MDIDTLHHTIASVDEIKMLVAEIILLQSNAPALKILAKIGYGKVCVLHNDLEVLAEEMELSASCQ